MSSVKICKAITRAGRNCRYKAKSNSDYCGIHLLRKRVDKTERKWKKVECVVCCDDIVRDPKIECKCKSNQVHRKCIIKDATSNRRQAAICPLCKASLPEVWKSNQESSPQENPEPDITDMWAIIGLPTGFLRNLDDNDIEDIIRSIQHNIFLSLQSFETTS